MNILSLSFHYDNISFQGGRHTNVQKKFAGGGGIFFPIKPQSINISDLFDTSRIT